MSERECFCEGLSCQLPGAASSPFAKPSDPPGHQRGGRRFAHRVLQHPETALFATTRQHSLSVPLSFPGV